MQERKVEIKGNWCRILTIYNEKPNKGWESIRKLRIENRVENDHQPVGIWLKSKIEKEKEGRVIQVVEKEV